jgi:hypothetical protein
MDIADAFTTEAINLTDANIEGEQESELRAIIKQVYQANQLENNEDHENIAVLCFVAGRAYQVQTEPEFSIPAHLVVPFIEFLIRRGGSSESEGEG